MFLVNLGYQCKPFFFFYSAFRWHCMSSSCCSCHILCCMVQPNQTPPSTAVEQTCCVDFVRLSLLSWLSFTCVKKWIKWECKWLLMLRTQLKALRIIYIRWISIGLLVPPWEKHLLLTGRFGVRCQLIIIPLVIFFFIFITFLPMGLANVPHVLSIFIAKIKIFVHE